jgi:AcrR family transcriptional regulator
MYIILLILPKNYSMNYLNSKIEPVFRFYLARGFDHSLQKVADAVHITKKTLFNRYISKENLEFCIVNYWQKKSNDRIDQRVEFTNNSVEKLMMFLFELQYCKNFEPHFFQKTKELFLNKKESNYPHIDKLEEIFNSGEAENLFQFEAELKLFAYFFLFNTMFVLLSDSVIKTEYIHFLLTPILTEKGKKMFKDIDIEQIFKP